MKTFWTVVIVILVLAVLGYGGYRIYHHYTWKATQTQPAVTQAPMAKAKPSAMMEEAVIKMASVDKLGTIVTDPKGMTLYTFANDKTGVSNCTGTCLQNWPPYVAKSDTGKFPTNVSVIKRSDGTLQYAWKGMPLYYYFSDKKPGDIAGNGIKGVWSVAK